MVGIKVTNYEHYNRSMGKWISSKKQYEEEMKRGNYVPTEEAHEIAEKAKAKNRRAYDGPSADARSIIQSVRNRADKDGNVKMSDREIDALKKLGMTTKKPKYADKLDPNTGAMIQDD